MTFRFLAEENLNPPRLNRSDRVTQRCLQRRLPLAPLLTVARVEDGAHAKGRVAAGARDHARKVRRRELKPLLRCTAFVSCDGTPRGPWIPFLLENLLQNIVSDTPRGHWILIHS